MTRTALPLFDGFIETPFERRFQGLLRGCVARSQLACHCGRARFWQDDGHW